jgi:aryl-alcohol dehydrogenase-like predicted oxidoreductase
MNRRILGRTGLEISEVGFGSWAIGGNSYGVTDDGESLAAIGAARGAGVNFFDTADIYGNGHSEELLGKALRDCRSEVVLASKAGWDFYHGGVRQNFDPEYIRFACRKSLERLGTDYLDLYQLHNPNLEMIRREDLFAPLEGLKKEGLIRHYGVSIHVPSEGLEAIRLDRVETIQLIYNLIDQRPAKELLPLAQERGVGIIAREPFACGLLTGKYDKTVQFQGPDHRRRWRPDKIELDLSKLEILKKCFPAGGQNQCRLPVLALEFVLGHPAVSTVIPGAKTAAQAAENARAADRACLDAGAIEKIRALYAEDPVFETGFYRN